MSSRPSEKQCIEELNQALKDQEGYEEGMEFKSLGANGSVHYYHPGLAAYHNDEGNDDFTFAPFDSAIKAYREKQM